MASAAVVIGALKLNGPIQMQQSPRESNNGLSSSYWHTKCTLFQVWQDPRLGWNPSAYAGINNLYLTVSDIWVPPLLLNNA